MSCLFTFQPGQSSGLIFYTALLVHSKPSSLPSSSSFTTQFLSSVTAGPGISFLFLLLQPVTAQIELSSSSKILLHTIQCWNTSAKLLAFQSFSQHVSDARWVSHVTQRGQIVPFDFTHTCRKEFRSCLCI